MAIRSLNNSQKNIHTYIHAIFLTVSNRCPSQKLIPDAKLQLKRNRSDLRG
jgi:hypothetical protein